MIRASAIDPSLAPLLAAWSKRLALQLGLDFPPERWPELARAVAAAASGLGGGDLRACLERLVAGTPGPAWMETLTQHLTIGETYFFRDPAAFAALRRHIVPSLLRARGGAPGGGRWLRLWSAGCSTGEEAYSIAITLKECMAGWGGWRITVLATDLNAQALAIARHGIYPEWSFRAVAPDVKARHFTREADGRYRIDPRLRAMVSFVPLNLAEEAYPAVDTNTTAMDVVFCRNVLMYLQAERARTVVERLERCLADGGWLVVSPVESALVATPALAAQRLPGVLLFRKRRPHPEQGAHCGTAPRVVAAPGPGAVRGPAACAAAEVSLPCRTATRPVGELSAPTPAARMATPCRGDAPPMRVEDALAGASALYAQGRYHEAVEALERLLAYAPDDGGAMLLLARALANLGQLSEALARCDGAVAAARLDPLHSYLRGSILLEQGRLDDAASAFRRSIYLEPECPLAQFALGNVCARQGRPARAARHYRHALAGLRHLPPDRVLPEADGLTAGRLVEMIEAILATEGAP